MLEAKKKNIESQLKVLEDKLDDLKNQMESNDQDVIIGKIRELENSTSNIEKEFHGGIEPIMRVKLARHPERPTTMDYIKYLVRDFIQFHGDRRFGDDGAIIGGIGIFEGIPVTVIGHQKGRTTKENIKRNFGSAYPEGYRKALRLMKQAEKFGRPVLSLINTPAAYPGLGAEERGQAEAIAVNLYEMSMLRTPIIAVVTGEGGSGGALGLGVADRVFMMSNTFYSVIPPEGCASILWKDVSRTGDAAEALKIDPENLLKLDIIDGIIEEPLCGAHGDYEAIAGLLKNKIHSALEELMHLSNEDLVGQRYDKFRKMGIFKENE